MSALAGLGIDNAYVDLDRARSADHGRQRGPFVFLLQSAGIEEQNAPKKFIRMLETRGSAATATSGCASSRYNGFKLTFTIEFDHPVFERIDASR